MSDTSSTSESAPAGSTSGGSPARYRVTLLLFAAVAAALVIWFQRHVEPYVTETLIVGGTISLWGIWKLFWSTFEGAGGDSGNDLTHKFLGGRGALRALIFAAIIVALLHLLTSSIYLRIGGARPGEESFKVRVLEGNEVFMGPFTIGPGQTIGHPMFPNFTTRHLTYQIESPRGFLPLSSTLALWGSDSIRVPGDFARKELHVLAFVPDETLYPDLPTETDQLGDRYYLELRAKGSIALLRKYLRGIVVTGAAAVDLPDPSTLAHDAKVREELNNHFAHAQIDHPEAAVAALMEATAMRLESVELAAGNVVEVRVGTWKQIDGKDEPQLLMTCHFQVPASVDKRTFMIGPGERGDCK
jgi:hypothetical protein